MLKIFKNYILKGRLQNNVDKVLDNIDKHVLMVKFCKWRLHTPLGTPELHELDKLNHAGC